MVRQKVYLYISLCCWIWLNLYVHASEIKDEEKRILVGSVDVQNEISFLKVTVQEMQSKLSQQESAISEISQQEQTISQLKSKLQESETKLAQQDTAIQKLQDKGGIYTRWGRKNCPTDNATELVYSGFAGGSHYSNSGAAAEYVCLPPDPILSTADISKTMPLYPHKYPAYMYGSEYETNFFGSHTQDEDVPCAVCRSRIRNIILMIPGRNQCYTGWNAEYSGNLASGLFEHTAASQYVCVDGSPEFLNKGQANENGKLFYPVITQCGSLPCPPYENIKAMTCVVCSK